MERPVSHSVFLKAVVLFLALVIINAGTFRLLIEKTAQEDRSVMGGSLLKNKYEENDKSKEMIQPDDQYIERFLRPSGVNSLPPKYIFNKNDGGIPKSFNLSSEVVRAYFDILSDASNLDEESGGCGSVGFEKAPYPFAYGLLSNEYKRNLSYGKFLKSFENIGHINLLKLIEGTAINKDNSMNPRYLVEVETVEGADDEGKTYFAYYYGYVSVCQDGNSGWKISSIDLNSEDFLCHAYHGWWHDASYIVKYIYGEKCGAIDKILGVEEDGNFRNVIAKGKDNNQYRFQFVRMTNGSDIELRQFVMKDGKWKDVHIDAGKYMDEEGFE